VFVLLLIVALILFGFGFLNPIWWLAAAVLVSGSTRHSRRHRAGWWREDGGDHERRGWPMKLPGIQSSGVASTAPGARKSWRG